MTALPRMEQTRMMQTSPAQVTSDGQQMVINLHLDIPVTVPMNSIAAAPHPAPVVELTPPQPREILNLSAVEQLPAPRPKEVPMPTLNRGWRPAFPSMDTIRTRVECHPSRTFSAPTKKLEPWQEKLVARAERHQEDVGVKDVYSNTPGCRHCPNALANSGVGGMLMYMKCERFRLGVNLRTMEFCKMDSSLGFFCAHQRFMLVSLGKANTMYNMLKGNEGWHEVSYEEWWRTVCPHGCASTYPETILMPEFIQD